MPNDDQELRRLQDAEFVAHELFDRMDRGVRDPEVRRHAKDLWMEAQAAVSRYRKIA